MGTWGSSTKEAAHAWRAGCTALGKPAYSGNEVDCAGHEGSHMKLLIQLHLRHIQTLPARSPARPQCQRSAATSYPRFSYAQRAGEQSTQPSPAFSSLLRERSKQSLHFCILPGSSATSRGSRTPRRGAHPVLQEPGVISSGTFLAVPASQMEAARARHSSPRAARPVT